MLYGLQVIAIRRHGYMYKTEYAKFAARYRGVLVFADLSNEVEVTNYDSRRMSDEILAVMQSHPEIKDEVLPGKTRLFYRQAQHRAMEQMLKQAEAKAKNIVVGYPTHTHTHAHTYTHHAPLPACNVCLLCCGSSHLKHSSYPPSLCAAVLCTCGLFLGTFDLS